MKEKRNRLSSPALRISSLAILTAASTVFTFGALTALISGVLGGIPLSLAVSRAYPPVRKFSW